MPLPGFYHPELVEIIPETQLPGYLQKVFNPFNLYLCSVVGINAVTWFYTGVVVTSGKAKIPIHREHKKDTIMVGLLSAGAFGLLLPTLINRWPEW